MIRSSPVDGSKIPTLMVIGCSAILLLGCTQRVGDLTLLSTKNIDLSDAELDARTGQRVTGQDCVPVVIVPLGLPNLEDATDEALEKGGGNVMVDQVSTFTSAVFIFGVHCIESEGTVLRIATKEKEDE